MRRGTRSGGPGGPGGSGGSDEIRRDGIGTSKADRNLALWAIASKDMRAVGANIQVWLPMLLLPVIFGVVIPGILLWALRAKGIEGLGDIRFFEMLPESIKLARASEEQQIAHFILNYMFAPFFLLIPLMAASVISADSFAGEKERGTLESLLFSPVDVRTLLIGKALAAFLPAFGLASVTLLLSAIVANLVGWPLFGALFFPNVNWIPLMLLVIPALSLAAILMNVFISAKVATFQAAYQLGGLVVLPALALVFGQVSGILLLRLPVIFLIGAVLVVIDVVLLAVLRRRLDRAQLFESQVR